MRALSLVVASACLVAGCGPASSSSADRASAVDALAQDVLGDYPDVVHVTPGELMGLLEEPDDVVLVDVRTAEEREVSIIPGAISREAFEARLDDLSGRRIVAYCTIGVRSSNFAREMAELGIEVSNLSGSILAWTHEGGALESDGRETERVHVYGPRWDLAADGYEMVW